MAAIKIVAIKFNRMPMDNSNQLLPFCWFYNSVNLYETVVDTSQYQFDNFQNYRDATSKFFSQVLEIDQTQVSIKAQFQYREMLEKCVNYHFIII